MQIAKWGKPTKNIKKTIKIKMEEMIGERRGRTHSPWT